METKPQQPDINLFDISNSATTDWVDAQGVMEKFPIKSRTLQNYRTKKQIPYAKLGGKIFYYLPGIVRALEESARRQSGIK